jgi:hypothetical protein
MFSEDTLNQIRAAKAARAAKQTETETETKTEEVEQIDETFDPIRNIEGPDADKELAGKKLTWTGW